MNLYIESKRALFTSELVYDIGTFIKAARKGDIEIKVPDGVLPAGALEKFQNESIDFTQDFGGEPGHGLPFKQFLKLLQANEDQLENILPEDRVEFVKSILCQIDRATEEQGSTSTGTDHDDTSELFLSTYRSIDQKVSCVYGVFKDKRTKRIIISFRGSQNPDFSTRDWRSNLNAKLAKMDTPALIADKMKGKLKKRVLVHKGFYNYLFNNKYLKKENLKQRIDVIIEDVKRVLEKEKGYTIQVHGHSLGGALASMLAFELAGRDEDWIPKPVNCVTYASPFNGSSGFKDAFEQLEKDNLIRYLRVTNDKDTVPTVPPFSLGWQRRNMKHVGINLRLNKKGKPLVTHSSKVGFMNAVRNSVFKPVWGIMTYHLLPFHETRLDANEEMLTKKTIDGIYDDKKIVDDDFNVVRA